MLAPSIVAQRSTRTTAERNYLSLVLLAFLAFVPLFFVVMPAAEWSAITLYAVILIPAALALYYFAIKPVDPTFPISLFLLASLAKMMGAIIRYWMVVDLYNGASDAPFYHEHGQILAQYFKVFDFSIMETYRVRAAETTNLAHITGFVYSLLPASMAGAFFFFAFLAFTGSVLFYHSVCVAWPTAHSQYYRLCIFFVPSILFWPSSLGKEAWLFFCSGLVFWGWTSFLREHNWFSLFWLVSGLFLINLIRPHFAAFLAIGMGAGYLLYSTRGQRSVIQWLVGAGAVVLMGLYMVQSGAQFLKLEEFSLDSIEDRMQAVQEQTTQGGSQYTPVSIFTPWGFAWGLITTVARPFPWEASSGQVLITALETSGWLLLAWLQRRVFRKKLLTLRADPIMGFAFFYVLISLLALTTIGNFGILARQRVLILPFIWMLFV